MVLRQSIALIIQPCGQNHCFKVAVVCGFHKQLRRFLLILVNAFAGPVHLAEAEHRRCISLCGGTLKINGGIRGIVFTVKFQTVVKKNSCNTRIFRGGLLCRIFGTCLFKFQLRALTRRRQFRFQLTLSLRIKILYADRIQQTVMRDIICAERHQAFNFGFSGPQTLMVKIQL